MRKSIQKRIKGNQVLELDPATNDTSSRSARAFATMNSDEPLSLQDFLLELNERIKAESPSGRYDRFS